MRTMIKLTEDDVAVYLNPDLIVKLVPKPDGTTIISRGSISYVSEPIERVLDLLGARFADVV